jgi:hypothetical protein
MHAPARSKTAHPLSKAGIYINRTGEIYLQTPNQKQRCGYYSRAYIRPKTSGNKEAEASVLVAEEEAPIAIE